MSHLCAVLAIVSIISVTVIIWASRIGSAAVRVDFADAPVVPEDCQ